MFLMFYRTAAGCQSGRHFIFMPMRDKRIFIVAKFLFLSILVLVKPDPSFCQDENLNVFSRWVEWTNGEFMLVRHLNAQAFAMLDERDEQIANLKSKQDWITRQSRVREILMEIIGPFPEKSPLNAKTTGVIKKDGYRIEKIIYESMPGFYVTGGLYLPTAGKGKKPAILFTSGHYDEAFRTDEYQVMILNLVKKGFIVFAIDPVGQGERLQYYDPEKNASVIGAGTREHSYMGHQCFISGVSVARYFIWDGIRAIDYLSTRKEVDTERIGITGHSGGGTQAAYIFAFDERIKAGAPVNYITGFRRLLESIGAQDAEQNFFNGVKKGLTHADLLQVRAPAPALIVAGTRDFFSIQGARETYDEVRKTYAAFEMEDNIGIVEDDWGHGYTQKLRESVCSFFQLNLGLPGSPVDEKVIILDPEELKVTRSGQIASSYENAETIFSINRKESQKALDKIRESRKNIEQHLARVLENAKTLSGYVGPDEDVKSVFRGRYQRNGYSVEMYALHGEGNCMIPMLLFIPEVKGKYSAIIYLHPEGKNADAAPGGKIEQLVKKGYIVAAPDVIGIGEVKNGNLNGANFLALMVGRSVVGLQAGDVSRVAKFLSGRADVDREKIGAMAFDEMCQTLLHAAAFDNSINSVTLVGPLISYEAVVTNYFYNAAFLNHYVAGALTAYDLPDLMGIIAPRKLAIIEPKDHIKQPINIDLVDREMAFLKKAYSHRNAGKNLNILPSMEDLNVFVNWKFK
jgi:dienelactone hydrolase